MNSFGACVRGPDSGGHNMEDGRDGRDGRDDKDKKDGKKSEKSDKGDKEKGPSLSIDRAAFLILRVKKAFKKKRQQRKERQ